MAQTVKHLSTMWRPRFDPWVGMVPEEGNGSPLQYYCLENPMDKKKKKKKKIPWTEEPGRLQSMGSQRVGHDWAIFTVTLLLSSFISEPQ